MALVVGSTAVAAGALTYTLARPFFKKKVECHFCNSSSKVNYADQNSWVCPTCEQYNGFTVDGDYNKPVHHTSSISDSFVHNRKQRQDAKNGLCKSCNLNQELKISQLSSFTGDDFELEEYQAHLERVYRLCADCEDKVSSRLSALDSLLAPGVIEHRLETSRLSSGADSVVRPSKFQTTLCDLQVLLSVLLFFVILNPSVNFDVEKYTSPEIGARWKGVVNFFNAYHDFLQLYMGILLALTSLLLLRIKTASIISLAPLLTIWLNSDLSLKLTAACLSATLLPLSPVKFKTKTKKTRKQRVKDTYSDKLIEPDSENLDDSQTGKGSSASKSSEVGRLLTGVMDKSPRHLFSGVGGLLTAPAPVRMSPPVRSGEEVSLSHEFAMENSSDCDLASLSLGEEETVRPTRVESPHFSSRLYNPENKSGIKFSPAKPLLRPSRLTSWVAGGYWTPPNNQVTGESLSRSSSQSSGFVSASVAPSIQNFNLSSPLNYVSLPNSPRNSVCEDCERCSMLSEPMMNLGNNRPQNQMLQLRRSTMDERFSVSSLEFSPRDDNLKIVPKAESSPIPKQAEEQPSASKEKPTSWYDKLSLTITITPVGFLLCASLVANLTVFYVYMLK